MPDPSLPPRMRSAPLRLTAMTLRGLGPYLHGARLEIKPLTILCGENGSGKSTWLEALRFLKSAAEDDQFPLNVPSESNCFTQHDVNGKTWRATGEDVNRDRLSQRFAGPGDSVWRVRSGRESRPDEGLSEFRHRRLRHQQPSRLVAEVRSRTIRDTPNAC